MKSLFSTIRQLVPRLQHIEEDRNELGNAPAQHKQVPDAVAVGQFSLERIENDSARVQQTAGKEPPESVQGQGPEQGFKSEDHEPSHEQVQDDRQNAPAIGKSEFNHDPHEGKAPYEAEEGPAQGAAQSHERERRITPRDQQVDGAVIHLSKNRADVPDTVIEPGGEVEHDERGAVDAEAHDLPRVAFKRGHDDKNCRAAQCEDRSCQMTDAIEKPAFIHGASC